MDRNDLLAKIWEANEAGDLIPVCAWCSRVRIEAEWFDLMYGDIAAIDEPMTLTRTICPRCVETHATQPSTRPSELPAPEQTRRTDPV
jgi:hypothetical protein